MTNFERLKFYYEKGWATKEQLRMYVQFNVITPAQYEEITGEVYQIVEE